MSDKILIWVVVGAGMLIATIITEVLTRWRQHKDNKTKLDSVLYETSPNSGKSMKDAVGRIEKKVDKLDDRQRDYGERLTKVETSVEHMKGR